VSHSHSISALSAAVQQQEYLERLRAAQRAERDEKIRKKNREKPFQDYLNSDREPQGEEDQEPAPDEGENPEPEAEPKEGFGTRYA
jgi:hypothetical protein